MYDLTKIMEKWNTLKVASGDAVLLFHIGDFLEAFAEDALTCARVLDLATTHCYHKGARLTMAGFPWFYRDRYIERLVAAGYRVAICDPTGDVTQ